MDNLPPLLAWIETSPYTPIPALAKAEKASSGWTEACINALRDIQRGGHAEGWSNLESGFTGETLRNILEKKGLRPKKPQSWGNLVGRCKILGIITPNGKRTRMLDPKANKRMTDVYVWGSLQ